jgi:hypothetical protein
VGLERVDGAADGAEVAPHSEVLDFVPHLLEVSDDVELHLPGSFTDVDSGHVLGRDHALVHQREHPELLHSAKR